MNMKTAPSIAPRRPVRPVRERGASLLEVLIAILIMSFGLLALGGLTAASVQYGKMAQFQSIGVQLASEYGDRMRANVDGFQANAYNKTAAYSPVTTVVATPACVVPTRCTAAEMAAIDQAEWITSLRQRLPGGDAYVQRDTTNVLAVNIWIMWTDPNLSYGADNSLSTGTAADCPDPAIAGVSPAPRCMFFRVSI